MGPEENTRLVKKGYKKFLSGDIQGLLALFTDVIELITPRVDGAPFYGTNHGRESVLAFFEALDDLGAMEESILRAARRAPSSRLG